MKPEDINLEQVPEFLRALEEKIIMERTEYGGSEFATLAIADAQRLCGDIQGFAAAIQAEKFIMVQKDCYKNLAESTKDADGFLRRAADAAFGAKKAEAQ